MIACSGTQIDSKPSSSHLRATETGSSVISENIAKIPIFIGRLRSHSRRGREGCTVPYSVRSRQSEQMLRHVTQNQVIRDRSGTVKARLAPFALDVIFLGEAVSAERIQRRFAGLPCGFRRQVLRHVGLAAARFVRIKERRGLEP